MDYKVNKRFSDTGEKATDTQIIAGYGADGELYKFEADSSGRGSQKIFIYNPDTMAYEAMTQPLIDATNSNLYLAVDGVETKLDSLIATTKIKVIDENGVAYGIKNANNKIRVSSTPYLYDIAKGNIANQTDFHMVGYNGDVDDVREDMWELGGSYVFPPAGGIQMKMVSSSANDTAAGTGARTVDIHYLDANYAEQTEMLTLNGITAVNTVATNILRINDIHVMTTGTGLNSAGNLSLTNITGTVTYGYISATNNALRQLIYTVPAGKDLYVTGMCVGTGSSAGNRMAEFALRVTTSHANELTPDVFHHKAIVIVQDNAVHIPFEMPIKCMSQSDIKISVKSDVAVASALCSAHISGWLESI